MKTLHTSITAQPAAAINFLFKLEKSGKYEEAFESLNEIWQDALAKPNVKEFEPRIAAEILLRSGAILGFLAHSRQDSEMQISSRNILTEAYTAFKDFYDLEKVAECENYLTLSYWRTGEFEESEAWLNEALSHNLPESNTVRLNSVINRSVLHISNKKFEKILIEFGREEINFQKYADAFLKGCFSTNYGIALKNTGKISESLNKFELARHYHQKSQHKNYLGTVENNIAQVFRAEHCFAKAHEAIDSAKNTFKQINDRAREGFCLDTKAQIYFDEGKLKEALDTAGKAEKILRKGDNRGFLVETLSTRIKILLHLDEVSAATLCLTDALSIAKTYINNEVSQRLVDDYYQTLKGLREEVKYGEPEKSVINGIFEKRPAGISANTLEEEMLELILPPVLSHHSSIQGVWLSNNYLEEFGLREGALAIVADEAIKRGDLIAVVEKATDAVVCGFFDYDSDFGLICLEIAEAEPQLFAEDEIDILGKIVGVSSAAKNEDGKLVIKEINF